MAFDILTTALRWLALGIAVIPIAYRSKLPDTNALRWTGSLVDGRPSWAQFQKTLTTEREVRTWTSGPRINLAVVTGWQNLVVLDFDTMDAWRMWYIWSESNPLAAQIADLTYRVKTGRGMHLYVSVEEPVRNGHVGSIDVKAGGGYVLCPPSTHPSGRSYVDVDPHAPICTVERLADIFPLDVDLAPVQHVVHTGQPDDPFEAAERAAQYGGGGLVRGAKRHRIEDFFPHAGNGHGEWMLTHCPFHDDSTPSFWINTEKQICGCYAGCTDKPLDVIDLYARMHGLSTREAMRRLAQ